MATPPSGQRLELRSELEIAASAELVSSVLCDLSRFPLWNPFLVAAEGEFCVGRRVKVTLSLPSGTELTVHRRVTERVDGQRLAWQGSFGASFLLQSVQFFALRQQPNGNCHLTTGENFSGLLLRRSSARVLEMARGLALMNQALKRFVETRVTDSR